LEFEGVYLEGFERVYKAALVLSGNRHVAEEAAQEAFAKALERWGRLGGEQWALGWVITTALNLVRRAHRGRATSVSMPELTEQDTDGSVDLWNGIRQLSRRQQEAIALHYIADLPQDQVAKAMGCEKGTVKAHLWRARQQLARFLEVHEDA
jgi:RNA polymerase sigma-70 factor (ECF subfamily)